MAYLSFCASIATLKFDIPILYAPTKKVAHQCFRLALMCSCVSAVVFTLIGHISRNVLFKNISLDIKTIFILWLGIFTLSVVEITRKLFVRYGCFIRLGKWLFTGYFLRASIPFFFLLICKDWRACFYGEILGSFIVLMFAGSLILFACKTKGLLWPVAKTYVHYPKYQLLSTSLNNITFASFAPVINTIFGGTAAGQFSFIYRLVLLPLSFLERAFSDFYQHTIVIAIKAKCLFNTFIRFLLVITFTSITLYSFLLLVLVLVSKTFFRENNDFYYLWPILLLGSIQFIVSPISAILFANSRGSVYKFFYDLTSFVFCIAYFFMANFYKISLIAFIKGLSGVLIITYILYLIAITHYVRNFRYTKP
jgi:hypothetical protein